MFLRNVGASGHHNTEFTKYLLFLQCFHLQRGSEAINDAKCDTLVARLLRIQVPWNVISCQFVYLHRCFEQLYCLRLQFPAFREEGLGLLVLHNVEKSLQINTL
jgi:hypothetical protein